MTKRLVSIRHASGPTDDRVTTWCTLRGVGADTFLRKEHRLIDDALAANSPFHGICQGAQDHATKERLMQTHDRTQTIRFYDQLDQMLRESA